MKRVLFALAAIGLVATTSGAIRAGAVSERYLTFVGGCESFADDELFGTICPAVWESGSDFGAPDEDVPGTYWEICRIANPTDCVTVFKTAPDDDLSGALALPELDESEDVFSLERVFHQNQCRSYQNFMGLDHEPGDRALYDFNQLVDSTAFILEIDELPDSTNQQVIENLRDEWAMFEAHLSSTEFYGGKHSPLYLYLAQGTALTLGDLDGILVAETSQEIETASPVIGESEISSSDQRSRDGNTNYDAIFCV